MATTTYPTRLAEQLASGVSDAIIASIGASRTFSREAIQRILGSEGPEFVTIPRLYRMRDDTMVKMGLNYRKSALIGAKWHMECADARIAAYCDWALRRVYGSVMRTALLRYDFGRQAAIAQWDTLEPGQCDATYENRDGDVKPVWTSKNVMPVTIGPPISVPPELAQVKVNSDTGRFEGFDVLATASSRLVQNRTVKPEHALWWVHEFEETFRDYNGKPLVLPAYRYWWSYWHRFYMEDRHFEADADPPYIVDYPRGSTDGRPNREIAREIATEVRNGSGIVKPSEVHVDPETGRPTAIPMWNVNVLRGGENLAAFRASAEYLDLMKLRSTLMPEEALIEGIQGTGSRATSGNRVSVFEESLGQEAAYDDLFINRYLLPDLVHAVFGEDAPPCRKVTTGFQEEDMSLATELIKTAFSLDPNALPLDMEKMVKDSGLPVLSPKEQQDKEEALAAAQQQAMQQGQPPEQAQVPPAPPDNTQLGITGGKYHPIREQIWLSATKAEPIGKRPPGWAQHEHEYRQANVNAVAERLQDAAQERYRELFSFASDYVAGIELAQAESEGTEGLDLALPSIREIGGFLDRMLNLAADALGRHSTRMRGELASMYAVSGQAELRRLGFDADSYDVGRDEVQEWARERAAELVTTMDKTVVERHLRPFLIAELEKGDDPLEIAFRMTDKFGGYPLWMAQRVAASEARYGYNDAALTTWENAGVDDVIAHDGHGGKTRKTDLECLRRNGEKLTINEAREENRKEHPNGTLGFLPVVGQRPLRAPNDQTRAAEIFMSQSAYAVTDDGRILDQVATGLLLAGD